MRFAKEAAAVDDGIELGFAVGFHDVMIGCTDGAAEGVATGVLDVVIVGMALGKAEEVGIIEGNFVGHAVKVIEGVNVGHEDDGG